MAASSEKGVSFGLGYVDSITNEINLATKYESLPEGLGKQTVRDLIRVANKIHNDFLKS